MAQRRLTVLLFVACVVACGNRHEMYWNGVRADGESWFGGEASYKSVSWSRMAPSVTTDLQTGIADTVWLISEAEEILGDGPRFAIRLPGGTVLRPDQLTVERLDAQAHTPGMIGMVSGSSAVFEYPNGRLDASFDEYGQLTHIGVRAFRRAREDQPGGGGVAVADRNGTEQLPLPATRDQLVEVFGEPALEKKRPGRSCWGLPC